MDAIFNNLITLCLSTLFNFTSFNQEWYTFYTMLSCTPTIISSEISYI